MAKTRENGIGVWYIGEDWVGATTVEEAKAHYIEHACLEDDEAADLEAKEVDLDAPDCIDTEAYYNDEDKRLTYRQVLQQHVARGLDFPAVVATENWQ